MKTLLIIFSACLLLLSISVCGCFGAAVASASAGSIRHPAHLLTRKFNKTKAFCDLISECRTSELDCTTECGDNWSCNLFSGICEEKDCVYDGDCPGSDPHCYYGTCHNCNPDETWNGYTCNECTADYQCPGSNSHCFLGTCYTCYGDESWDGFNCDDLSGYLGLAIGIVIFMFVGIPLIIIGSIVACCFCCPGCPGHNCRQRRSQQAQQQTYFVAPQNQNQQQYPYPQQQSEPTPNPEARY